MTRALTAPVRGLDRLRWLWLKALGPLAKPLVRRRELRVAVAGTSLIGLALLGAIFLPMWLLALGPIVWGVPHVLGDVRYLWVRPGHHRRLALSAAVGVSLLILSVTAHPSWGFASAGLAALLARGAWWKKALAAAVAVGLVWVAWRHSFWTAVVFAHAHNLIGVALWWSWRRRMGRLHWLPLAAFVAGGALLLNRRQMIERAEDLGIFIYGFEPDRPRETPRTFAATLRALRADFGAPLLALAFLAAVGLAGWAAWDVFAARHGYLRAVLFHGHLELVAAALLFVEGTRPRGATERAGQPAHTRDAA